MLVGNDESLERSEATLLHMEVQGHPDLAAIVQRNLLIVQGLWAVDALLLTFCVWEVLNFEQWEVERVVEEVPTQDQVEETGATSISRPVGGPTADVGSR